MAKTRVQLLGELEALRALVAEKRARDPAATGAREELGPANYELLDAVHEGIMLLDLGGRFLFMNRALEGLMGRSREQMVGGSVFDFVAETVSEDVLEKLLTVLRASLLEMNTPPIEYDQPCPDGTVISLSCTASYLLDARGMPRVLVVGYRDVTRRKQEEQKRLASEATFRVLADQSPNMIFINRRGRVVYVNRMAVEAMGYDPEELLAPDFDFLCLHAPESRESAKENFARHLRGEEVPPKEYTLLTKSGQERVVLQSSKLIPYGGEQAILGVATDITERKRAEDVLRESEEIYRTLVRTSPDAITVMSLDGTVSEVSQQAVEKFGFSAAEEMVGRNALEMLPPSEHRRARRVRREILEKGFVRTVEYEILRKDGSSFLGEMNASLLRDARGRPKALVTSVRDVTQRKQVEADLARVQRLESLGILAGGIAHDFNNVLSAISLNLSTARMFGEHSEEIEKMLADAETATLRARSLTQQLLTFAKGGLPVKKPLFLPRLLRETVSFALSGSSARCDYGLPEELWPVEADEGQIGNAIQNLVINADQAMPAGGVIRVTACNETLKENERPPLKAGRHVRISVSDQGVGIPENNLQRVFDPFFTTKYKGSGLGLTACFSIIQKHDGHICVRSQPGAGSTFDVFLPALDRHPSPPQEEKRLLFRAQGRLLLIDDDAVLRRAACEALRRMGFRVEFAVDGEEGIGVYRQARQSGSPFDAVIMDLTIPGGMGGKEAIGKLLELDPGAKVIVSSGYADDPVMARYREFGFSAAVAKPYRIEEMAGVLEKILGDPGA